MARNDEARTVLTKQCEASIRDCENSIGKDTCKAHEPLVRGLCTLLQCQIARFEEDTTSRSITKRTAALVGTAAGAATAMIWSWFCARN